MRYFSLIDFQHWVVAVDLGLILTIAVYLAWRGYPQDREPVDLTDTLPAEDVPESGHHPMAPVLVFIFAGTIAWMIGYALVEGFLGGPIY